MKKNTKFVSFLLDETGSMYPIKDDTIGGFNAYVETLRKDGADIAFSLVTFNSNNTQRRYVAEPINKIGPLTEANYEPDAATPLIDASVKIINATDEAVKLRTDDPTVLVVIQTDGEENCSVEHTVADLALLVKEKTAAGWEFVFLGAGLDAFAAARDAGLHIDPRNTLAYDKHSSRAMFQQTAQNHSQFLEQRDPALLHYSKEQRAEVGDTFTVKHLDPTDQARQNSRLKKSAPRKRRQTASSVEEISLTSKTNHEEVSPSHS
jgi:hypothetical protein